MAKVAYTAATLAAEVSTDEAPVTPKALRVFLRTPDSGIESVGKGGRYSIEMTATQLAKFKKNFTAWKAAQDAAKAARAAEIEKAREEKAAKELNVLTVATPEVDEVEPQELDFENMTDEAIEAALDEIAAEGTDEA